MKKLLTLLFILVLLVSLSVCVCATETADSSADLTTINWTAILGISGGAGALIIAVIGWAVKHITQLKNTFTGAFTTIFTNKDGNIENIYQAFKSIETTVKDVTKDLKDDIEKLEKELKEERTASEQFKHVLSVYIINSNYLNPYAKSELLKLICGENEFGKNVGETLNNVDEAVTRAREMEEKPETPYLDKIASDVAEEV